MEESVKEALKYLAYVSAVLLAYFFKSVWGWAKRKWGKDPVGNSIKYDTSIKYKLIELRKDFDADRATVLQFHNGHTYSAGSSMQMYSMSHESVSQATRIIASEIQNRKVSLDNEYFDAVQNTLGTRQGFVLHNSADIPDKMLRAFVSLQGARTLISCPLLNDLDQFVGVLSVCFVHDYKNERDIDKELFVNYAAEISYLLMQVEKESNQITKKEKARWLKLEDE